MSLTVDTRRATARPADRQPPHAASGRPHPRQGTRRHPLRRFGGHLNHVWTEVQHSRHDLQHSPSTLAPAKASLNSWQSTCCVTRPGNDDPTWGVVRGNTVLPLPGEYATTADVLDHGADAARTLLGESGKPGIPLTGVTP